MAASDPSFPSPADGTFDGPLAAMVVVIVAIAVGAVLWSLVRPRLRRTPPDSVEPHRSRSQRTRDVADQLRQLQLDRDAGLLTEAEYDRRRRALLDDR